MDTATRSLDREADIDLRLVVAKLWAKRWWIAASIVSFTVAFGAAAFFMTPIYRATTVLVPAQTDTGGPLGSSGSGLQQLGGLASLAGMNLSSDDLQTEESLAVMQSREFTEALIRDMHLMPELFRDRWNANANQWKGRQKDWPTPARGFKYFDEHVRTVSRDKVTGLIRVDIEWRDPVEAAVWANTLVARLNAEMGSRAIASTNASLDYLQRELAATSVVETKQAIGRLMEAQINRRMVANVTREYAFRVVDRALPPDPRDMVKPQKLLLLVLGPVLGIMFGAFMVLVADALAPHPRAN